MLGNFRPSTFHLPLSGAARRPGLDRTGGDDRLVTPGVTGPAGTFWSFRAIIISLERAARRRSCGVGATANALGAGPGRGGFGGRWIRRVRRRPSRSHHRRPGAWQGRPDRVLARQRAADRTDSVKVVSSVGF